MGRPVWRIHESTEGASNKETANTKTTQRTDMHKTRWGTGMRHLGSRKNVGHQTSKTPTINTTVPTTQLGKGKAHGNRPNSPMGMAPPAPLPTHGQITQVGGCFANVFGSDGWPTAWATIPQNKASLPKESTSNQPLETLCFPRGLRARAFRVRRMPLHAFS